MTVLNICCRKKPRKAIVKLLLLLQLNDCKNTSNHKLNLLSLFFIILGWKNCPKVIFKAYFSKLCHSTSEFFRDFLFIFTFHHKNVIKLFLILFFTFSQKSFIFNYIKLWPCRIVGYNKATSGQHFYNWNSKMLSFHWMDSIVALA